MATAILRTLTARQSRCTIPLHTRISGSIQTTASYTPTLTNSIDRPQTKAQPPNQPFTYRSFTSSSILLDNDNDDDTTTTTTTEIPPRSFHQYTEDLSKFTTPELLDPTTIPGFTTLIHSPPMANTTPRHALVGTVVSDKMDKTVNVAVDRYKMLPIYRKRKKYTRKFMAHDEGEECREGDLVMIVPCQRLSKMKHFKVERILKAKGIL